VRVRRDILRLQDRLGMPGSHDVELIQPGLGESPLTVLQIQPHVNDFGAGAGEIELGPPMSRYAVRHGFRENIGEGARR
jgi:hypothetical protein